MSQAFSYHLNQRLEQGSRKCLVAWEMLDLRLSPEQVEVAETLRKSAANQLKNMGYRETKSLSPVVRVQGPLHNLPCTEFDVPSPAIPTAQVHDDSRSTGQCSHANLQNSVAIDFSELASAAYFCLPKMIALSIRCVLRVP